MSGQTPPRALPDTQFTTPELWDTHTHRSRAVPQPGEQWVYQAPSNAVIERVQVAGPPEGKPARIKVQFLDAEGRVEFVVPRRLRARWEDHAFYRDVRDATRRAKNASVGCEYIYVFAAREVLKIAGLGNGATEQWPSAGEPLIVRDPVRVRQTVGVSTWQEAISDPAAFAVNGVVTLPWRATEPLLRAMAAEHRATIARHVARYEARLNYQLGDLKEPGYTRMSEAMLDWAGAAPLTAPGVPDDASTGTTDEVSEYIDTWREVHAGQDWSSRDLAVAMRAAGLLAR